MERRKESKGPVVAEKAERLKFVNGSVRLVADGYVFIETSDNAQWFAVPADQVNGTATRESVVKVIVEVVSKS